MSVVEVHVDERGTVYIRRQGERVYTALDLDNTVRDVYYLPRHCDKVFGVTQPDPPPALPAPPPKVLDVPLPPFDHRGPRSA
jgi:hypothetical protein